MPFPPALPKKNAPQLAEIRNLHTEAASRAAVPALSDPNDIVRATAAGSVVFLPSAEAADILIKLLKDNSAFVRKEAAYALAKVGDATTMLGEENERSIADALSAVLRTDKDPEVRSAVVIAMGKTGGLYSVERLLSLLKADRNPDDEFLRRSAIRSIGTVAKMTRSGKRSIPSLRNGMSAEDFQYLDYTTQFRYFAEAGKFLIAILQDKGETDDVRREAAAALGDIGDLEAVPYLTDAQNAADPYLAANAKEALEKLKLIKR